MSKRSSGFSSEEESDCTYQPKRSRCIKLAASSLPSPCEPRCAARRLVSAPGESDMIDHWRTQEARLQPSSPWHLQNEVTPGRRCMLVTWLLNVAHEFKLSLETRLLAIDLLDRYLATTRVPLPEFRLTGITCLWVAAKYDEVHPPSNRHLAQLTGNQGSELVDMELRILMALGFEVGRPTPLRFFEYFWLKAGAQSKPLDRLARHLMEVSALASCPHYDTNACSVLPAVQTLPRARQAPAQAPAPQPIPSFLKSALERQSSTISTNTVEHCTPSRTAPSPPASPPSRASSCSLAFSAPGLSPFPTPQLGHGLMAGDSTLSSGTARSPTPEAAAPYPDVSNCCCGDSCCLATARPSFIAAAALYVAFIMGKQQSQQLQDLLCSMAQCTPKQLLQLSQALLQLQMAAVEIPGWGGLMQRYKKQVRARRTAADFSTDSCMQS